MQAYNTVRRALFARIPAEVLAVISLVTLLASGCLWGHSSIFITLLAWIGAVWWQRFIASGCITFTAFWPTWATVLPLVATARASDNSSSNNGNARIVLVTGTNSGVGYETCIGLLQLGYTVILTTRSSLVGASTIRRMQDYLKLPEHDVFVPSQARRGTSANLAVVRLCSVELDLSSEASVRRCADQVADLLRNSGTVQQQRECGGLKLFALVNNAGACIQPDEKNGNATRTLSFSGRNAVEENLGANFCSPLLLTDLLVARKLFLDVSKRDTPPRVIHLSSIGHNIASLFGGGAAGLKQRLAVDGMAWQSWPAALRSQFLYCDSKLCNQLGALGLAVEQQQNSTSPQAPLLLHFGVSPGVAMTSFFRFTFLARLHPMLVKIAHLVLSLVAKYPIEGAATSLHCVTSVGVVDRGANNNNNEAGYYSDASPAAGLLVMSPTASELAAHVVSWGRTVCGGGGSGGGSVVADSV